MDAWVGYDAACRCRAVSAVGLCHRDVSSIPVDGSIFPPLSPPCQPTFSPSGARQGVDWGWAFNLCSITRAGASGGLVARQKGLGQTPQSA